MAKFLYIETADSSRVGQIINVEKIEKIVESGSTVNVQLSDLNVIPVRSTLAEFGKHLELEVPEVAGESPAAPAPPQKKSPDETGDRGPSGEPVVITPAGPKDHATGLELPREIAGIPLPANFNSANPKTWPEGLTVKQITDWRFENAKPREDDRDLDRGTPVKKAVKKVTKKTVRRN